MERQLSNPDSTPRHTGEFAPMATSTGNQPRSPFRARTATSRSGNPRCTCIPLMYWSAAMAGVWPARRWYRASWVICAGSGRTSGAAATPTTSIPIAFVASRNAVRNSTSESMAVAASRNTGEVSST